MATRKRAATAATKKSGAATTVAATPGKALQDATTAAASGALIEPDLASASVIDHPAVDANPRQHSTAEMNQIDFNMPSALKPQDEQVEENLTADPSPKGDK